MKRASIAAVNAHLARWGKHARWQAIAKLATAIRWEAARTWILGLLPLAVLMMTKME